MGWFKRLCLFVFGLAGILALVALCLPWVGPYTGEATALIHDADYFVALEVVVGITGLGCLICLLRALFTPRNRKEIIISQENGDQITVTRAAIASQAEHIVERDGSCTAGTVRVNARKHGNIKVFVRVTPKRSLNVVDKGRELHAELDEGLAQIAADKVRSVNLEFTDPEEMDVSLEAPASSSAATSADADLGEDYDVPATYASYADDLPAADTDEDAPDEPAADAAATSNGITVSMSSFHRDDAPAAPEPTDAPVQEGEDDASDQDPTEPISVEGVAPSAAAEGVEGREE